MKERRGRGWEGCPFVVHQRQFYQLSVLRNGKEITELIHTVRMTMLSLKKCPLAILEKFNTKFRFFLKRTIFKLKGTESHSAYLKGVHKCNEKMPMDYFIIKIIITKKSAAQLLKRFSRNYKIFFAKNIFFEIE